MPQPQSDQNVSHNLDRKTAASLRWICNYNRTALKECGWLLRWHLEPIETLSSYDQVKQMEILVVSVYAYPKGYQKLP